MARPEGPPDPNPWPFASSDLPVVQQTRSQQAWACLQVLKTQGWGLGGEGPKPRAGGLGGQTPTQAPLSFSVGHCTHSDPPEPLSLIKTQAFCEKASGSQTWLHRQVTWASWICLRGGAWTLFFLSPQEPLTCRGLMPTPGARQNGRMDGMKTKSLQPDHLGSNPTPSITGTGPWVAPSVREDK